MNTSLCLSLIVTASGALAGITPHQFPLTSRLTPPPVRQGEIGAFVLTPDFWEALDGAKANLRLFDQADREIPYWVRPKAPASMKESLVPSGHSVSFESLRQRDGNIIELVVVRNDSTNMPCAIQFESGIRNFEKLVTVSGSRDSEHWTVLAKDEPIYDYSRFADVRKDQVRITPGAYSRFKIEISNIVEKKDSPLVQIIRQTRGQTDSNETEATSFLKEPFRINHIVFLERRESLVTGGHETRETEIGSVETTQDPRKQESVLVLKTHGQPITGITFVTDDANFSRSLLLECESETPPKTWIPITQGQISRLRIGSLRQDHLTLNLPCETRFRRYRLTFRNLDNPPLGVMHILIRENLYEALFFPRANAEYRVCLGGDGVDSPRYDVGAVLSGVPAGAAQIWTPGPLEKQAGYTKDRRHGAFAAKRLLTVALILMAVGLIVVVARFARKVENEDGQAG